jgi:hypothetical protein
MGHLSHAIQFQETGQSLDGVESAEDGIDGFGITRVLLQHEGTALDGRQVLARFQDKIRQELRILRQRIGLGFRRRRGNGAGLQGLLHGCHTRFERARKGIASGRILRVQRRA